MNPDAFDDPRSTAAEARDNRRAILVAVVAIGVVIVACVLLFATSTGADGRPSPGPTHSMGIHPDRGHPVD